MGEALRKRILVVEDEPLVAMLLEDMVRNLGFDVVGPALRLDEALALVESGLPDAAILDVNLGNCRSYPLADLLARRGVPFLFATGYGSPGLQWSARVPLLRKPFGEDILGSTLSDLLRAAPPQ